jgi:Glycosyl transferase family 2|nr:MAG: hypothetical protein [Caudoviricetes sp.]
MKTIISHFYNEEYLLPWWLNHHKKYFDDGIMINYASTDNSVNIIKEICPNWTIINSKNQTFSAAAVDQEVMEIESNIKGWKIALNTTEFLVGKYSILTDIQPREIYVPCFYFVDDQEFRNSIDKELPLFNQLFYGLDVSNTSYSRGSRALHNHIISYSPGRHFRNAHNTNEFIIFNYGFSPMTKEFYERKLQIQNRIPDSDKSRGLGGEHTNNGMGLTKDSLLSLYNSFLPKIKNLKEEMDHFITLMECDNA